MPTSCRLCSILSQSTISFELYAKIAEETDLEKCNFRNFRSSVTLILTLDQVEVILVCICGRGQPTHQIRSKSKQNLFCGRTDVRTDRPEFQSIRYIFMDYQYEDNDGTGNCTYSNNHYAVHVTLP